MFQNCNLNLMTRSINSILKSLNSYKHKKYKKIKALYYTYIRLVRSLPTLPMMMAGMLEACMEVTTDMEVTGDSTRTRMPKYTTRNRRPGREETLFD